MLPEGVQHIGKPGMLENHGDGDHGGLKRKTAGLLVAPQQLAQIHDAEHFVGIPAHDRKECVFRCADELEEGFRRLVAVEPLHLMAGRHNVPHGPPAKTDDPRDNGPLFRPEDLVPAIGVAQRGHFHFRFAAGDRGSAQQLQNRSGGGLTQSARCDPVPSVP